MIVWRPRLLIYLGLTICLLGFLYDVIFAGIPYQDPTPAMQASWLFHSRMAANIRLAGMFVLASGGGWSAINFALRAMRS